jgi:hypothetical protein
MTGVTGATVSVPWPVEETHPAATQTGPASGDRIIAPNRIFPEGCNRP